MKKSAIVLYFRSVYTAVGYTHFPRDRQPIGDRRLSMIRHAGTIMSLGGRGGAGNLHGTIFHLASGSRRGEVARFGIAIMDS